jgi:hypothetical protein
MRILCCSLLVLGACKTATSGPDAGRRDAGYHPQAPDGSVCDLGAVWLGDTCTVIDCSARADLTVCQGSDGDAGQCLAATCRPAVNFATDPLNCSVSGAACAVGATCAHGECFIDGGMIDTCTGIQCPSGDGCLYAFCSKLSCAGATRDELCEWGDAGGPGPWGHCCNDACTFLGTPNNCGGCGVVCPSGYVCADEACQPIDACGPGDNQGTCAFADGGAGICCDGTCVDLGGDARHCGNCGEVCPAGSFCSGQVCRTDAGSSSPPLADCEDAGCAAGTLCATGYSCRLTSCPADSNGDNCITSAGPSDGTCCTGACADTITDTRNCGGCGIACSPGEICVNSACAEPLDCTRVATGPCAWDGGLYQGTCCEGQCVGNGYLDSPAGDADCGRCGGGCPTGTHCGLYYGTDPICFSDIDAGPVFPPPGCSVATCPTERGCTGQQCFPTDCTGLSAGAICAMGVDGGQGICCQGSCVSQHTASSCGRCGATCPSGTTCSGGSCSSACVPDAGNCPGGSMCAPSERVCLTTSCRTLGNGATCAVPGLLAGELRDGLCCGGACIDPLQDPGNCGSCGAFCPSGVCSGDEGTCFNDTPQACLVSCGPDQLCSGETCLSAVCPYVDPSPCASIFGTVGVCCPDRACADLTIDPGNCGRCGVACLPGQVCVAGVCD